MTLKNRSNVGLMALVLASLSMVGSSYGSANNSKGENECEADRRFAYFAQYTYESCIETPDDKCKSELEHWKKAAIKYHNKCMDSETRFMMLYISKLENIYKLEGY